MRRRFGYYFVGLAIGLVLLGLLESAKFWAKQQQQEQAASPAPGASK